MIFIRIGKNCIIPTTEILMIVSPASAPIKRILDTAKEEKTNIDVTCGGKTRSLILLKNGSVVQSYHTVENLQKRINVQMQSD